jgi:hypothetical protein
MTTLIPKLFNESLRSSHEYTACHVDLFGNIIGPKRLPDENEEAAAALRHLERSSTFSKASPRVRTVKEQSLWLTKSMQDETRHHGVHRAHNPPRGRDRAKHTHATVVLLPELADLSSSRALAMSLETIPSLVQSYVEPSVSQLHGTRYKIGFFPLLPQVPRIFVCLLMSAKAGPLNINWPSRIYVHKKTQSVCAALKCSAHA